MTKNKGCCRGSHHQLGGLLLLMGAAGGALGCSSYEGTIPDESEDELGNVSQGVCQDHWQAVESYEDIEGVPREFIDAHERPVGILRSDTGRCSGTLIGDGLFLTAAHCFTSAIVNRPSARVEFNFQTDADGNPEETEAYRVAQVLEENPGGVVTDHALLRLYHNPNERFGFTAMEARDPSPGDPLVLIGHPAARRKVVDVGSVRRVDPETEAEKTNVVYRSLDVVNGASGAGVLDANTGRLIAMTRSGPDSCGTGSGNGNTMTRTQRASEFLDTDHGSGRLYSYTDAGASQFRWAKKNWRSTWDEILVGRFGAGTGLPALLTNQLFFYDRSSGDAQFYTVSKGAFTQLGAPITGLNDGGTNWTKVVPVQIDDTVQQELLFYDPIHGFGRFFATDGAGGLTTAGPRLGWGKNWRHIIAGNFTSRSGDELLFYDRTTGEIFLYGTNGSGGNRGKITKIASLGSYGTDISIMVPGQFDATTDTDEVLLYNPVEDYITFLSIASDGAVTEFGRHEGFGNMFTQIVPGDFTDAPWTELLFYEPSPDNYYDSAAPDSATFTYYSVAGGELTQTLQETGHRRSYSKLVFGSFWTETVNSGDLPRPAPSRSLLFYDRYRE